MKDLLIKICIILLIKLSECKYTCVRLLTNNIISENRMHSYSREKTVLGMGRGIRFKES